MPPPQKNWPPVARLSLSDQNGRTVTISTEGTVPGRIGKNKRQAAVSQLASWELFWGDGSRNGDVGPPPLELEHTYDATLASAVIRLVVVDVNTLTASATMTISGLTGLPTAPQDVTLTVLSDTSIRVNWSDPSALSTSFTVERRLAGVGSFVAIVSNLTTTTYIDTGLTPATAYEYRVQGFNNVGGSPYSNTAAATTDPSVPPATPPAAPSALAASGTVFGQVTLTWTDNASDETGFSIERALSGGSFSEIATVQANTVTYVDLTVAASTAYQYRVRAFNAAGNSAYSNTASVTTAAPPIPAAPTNLVATPQTPTSVLLAWTDNANNEANFELERRIGTQAFARIITLAPNLTSYLDPTAQPATIYQYRIRATNAAGTSAYSNIATATTPAAPPPDPPVVVLTPNATTIQVGTATILSTLGTHAGSAPLASWHLEWGDGFVQDGSGAPPASFTRTYALPNPSQSSTFVPSLRVTDTNSLAATAFSPPITVTPPPPTPLPPAAPTNLTATLGGLTQANLAWTDNATDETGNKIERRVPAAAFAQIATTGPNVSTFQNTGLSPSTTYEYRVRAYKTTGGDSAYSNVASVFVPPASPTFFISTTGNDTTGNGTQLNPWRTPAKGQQALTPGATLYFRGGLYPDAGLLETIPSGTSTARVTLASFPGETATWRPPSGMHVLSFAGSQQYIDIVGINLNGINCSADTIRIYGLSAIHNAHHIRIQGRSYSERAEIVAPFAFAQHVQCSGQYSGAIGACEFRYLTLHGGGTDDFSNCFYLQSPNNLVEWCELYDIFGAGVQIYNGNVGGSSPDGNIVRFNIMRDFTRTNDRTDGVIVGPGNNNQVYHNLIYNLQPDPVGINGGQGASAGYYNLGGTNNQCYNNTIVNCLCRAVYIEFGSATIVRNTIGYGSVGWPNFASPAGGTIQSNNLFGTDPKFVNPAANNYQLQLGSPAIDAAMTISTIPALDLLGVSRPQAAAWDIGCYERVF